MVRGDDDADSADSHGGGGHTRHQQTLHPRGGGQLQRLVGVDDRPGRARINGVADRVPRVARSRAAGLGHGPCLPVEDGDGSED
ncbi:hypothetical protein SDC9_129536 [bioreactor metagenome]|uniref:Uncharacterized protein n=1 Tax=bioreactor metagenome TaxID=1076179 RepID=A0A645D021_9ZZZZ